MLYVIIGLLLSYSGLISAFTNRYLLRYVTTINYTTSISSRSGSSSRSSSNNNNNSSSSNIGSSTAHGDIYDVFPEQLLWCYVLGALCGLYTWAVGSTVVRYDINVIYAITINTHIASHHDIIYFD